jgi:sugar lactone lactonase YvrE
MRLVRLCTTLISITLAAAACGSGTTTPADSGAPDAGSPDAVPEPPDAGDPCVGRKPLPVDVVAIPGFTGAEDFAFDAEGHYVAVNESGDLIQISREGERRLLVPGVGADTAGTHYLPSGEITIAKVGTGTLIAVAPDGTTRTLTTGLQYPNGLDVALDGTVYVAEQNAGRLRAVNSTTGEFRIVALGMNNPNGVVVGNDGNVFVGSFGGGVVYEVDLSTPTLEGRTRIFGRTPGGDATPEPVVPCLGLAEGDSCTPLWGGSGTCQSFGGELDCLLEAPCEGLSEGDPCIDPWVGPGTCEDQGGELVCVAGGTQCTNEGTACVTWGGTPGVCVDTGFGLECMDATCAGLNAGDPCIDANGELGVCTGDATFLACYDEPACNGGPGDPCVTDYGDQGSCVSNALTTVCQPTPGCAGAAAGDVCTTSGGAAGHCSNDAIPVCAADDDCAGRAAGDACLLDQELAGTCVDHAGTLRCDANNPCATLAAGAGCMQAGANGSCQDVGGGLACVTYLTPFIDACATGTLGGACDVQRFGETFSGICLDLPGRMLCSVEEDLVTPCSGAQSGDSCEGVSPFWGRFSGTCESFSGEPLTCYPDWGGGGGGLDGLNADACGYVYVTEYVAGKIWQIDPDGVTEEAAQLDSSWIPNMHWGPGTGGFGKRFLYVADRDQGRLFELDLGVMGSRGSYTPEPAP